MSSVAIFGGFAFAQATQDEADRAMEMVIEAGVNHIDVAPTYGDAELRLGPWLARARDRFFVGCKTTERTKERAARELRDSLERLQIDAFDLYQLHAVTTMEELEQATGPEGALQAVLEARAEGLTRFVGITGHGLKAPSIFLEALSRFDFDSVLFPVNFVLWRNDVYRREAEKLLRECRARDVGIMGIKAIARSRWQEGEPWKYTTWYRPFDQTEMIQQGIDFALSQGVTDCAPRVISPCCHVSWRPARPSSR